MKFVVILLSVLFFNLNTVVFAQDGEGKIIEVRSCVPHPVWRSMVQFKLSDGNWFGVYGVYHGGQNNYGDTVTPGLVMLAFSAGYSVKVRANYTERACGGITSKMIYTKAHDYIHVIK